MGLFIIGGGDTATIMCSTISARLTLYGLDHLSIQLWKCGKITECSICLGVLKQPMQLPFD